MLGYVYATDTKKPEVLQLIAKILEFSADELEQALCGHNRNRGWLAGLWKGSDTPKQSEVQLIWCRPIIIGVQGLFQDKGAN